MSYISSSDRFARRQARELAKQEKEQTKHSEQVRTRLEVENYQRNIEGLLSIHKEVGETKDWLTIASTLPPLPPSRSAHHEQRARQFALIQTPSIQPILEAAIAKGKAQDEAVNRTALQYYEQQFRKWSRMRELACRVLSGELKAYSNALEEFGPFAELTDMGTEVEFTMHSPTRIECVLTVKASDAIPNEAKSLTSTGKLAVKPMPRTRFHEIYQDHVCGCVLRVARETFAVLPIEQLLITATTAIFDSASGLTATKPVLSVLVSRSEVARFQWDLLDPSDAIDRLLHRSDFKATRKTGAFQAIEPMTAAVFTGLPATHQGVSALLAQATALRQELQDELTLLAKRV